MGFVLSKVSWFWSPAGYDVPDPASGITPRQKDIVRNMWKVVRADSRKYGPLLFVKIFEMHPEFRPFFPGFADVPLDQLPSNGLLLGHGIAVVYSLNSVVDNLDDQECLAQLLKKIGRSHRIKGITREPFKCVPNIVVEFMRDVFGALDKRSEEAWRKAMEVACGVIIGALEGTD